MKSLGECWTDPLCPLSVRDVAYVAELDRLPLDFRTLSDCCWLSSSQILVFRPETWTAVLDSNSASPAPPTQVRLASVLIQQGISVNGSRRGRAGRWIRARTVTGTSTTPSGERLMGCTQRCRRFQLRKFHVSDGLEIDSCDDLIFRPSDQTIAGITTVGSRCFRSAQSETPPLVINEVVLASKLEAQSTSSAIAQAKTATVIIAVT